MKTFQPRGEDDEFQKVMSLVKNLPIQWELRRKTGQRSIDEKPPNSVRTEEENRDLITEA